MTDSSSKSLAWAPIALILLLVGLGAWDAFGWPSGPANNDAAATNAVGDPALRVSGNRLSYYASTGATFVLTPPTGWSLKQDSAGVRVLSNTGEEIDLGVEPKEPTQSLADFVASQTYAAPVGEGSYDTPQGLSINGIPTVRITGSYVAPLVSYAFLLSDSEVLTAGGHYASQTELADLDAAVSRLAPTPVPANNTFADPALGITFSYPSDWLVTPSSVRGGSYETTDAGRSLIIEPPAQPLTFAPAGRCVIQEFSSQGATVDELIDHTTIYTDRLLTIQSRHAFVYNGLTGVLISEGGENAQRTTSFYFQGNHSGELVRFGYFNAADTGPTGSFLERSRTCEGVLSSLMPSSGSDTFKTYSSATLGLTFQYPSTFSITSTSASNSFFTLSIDDSAQPSAGGMTISNRASGFETDRVLDQGTTTIGGKPVRSLLTFSSQGGASTESRRYLFSPLNNDSPYAEYWIAFPVKADGTNAPFDAIVQSVHLSDNYPGMTSVYEGDGFSVSYPSTWTMVTIAGAAPRFTPKDTTFYLEGSVDYPINVGTTPQNATDYVSRLPAANKTAVTMNGHKGYKAYSTYGHQPFYVFTLADGKHSVTIGYAGDLLDQTAGQPVSEAEMAAVFESMAHSIHIP